MTRAILSGGEELAPALAKLAAKLAKPATLSVGFLEGKTYPENGTSLPLVAAMNEYGHRMGAAPGSVPPRPFFRNMVAAKKGRWPATLAKLLQANEFDAVKSLRLMGEGIKGQLQQSIGSNTPPPNAPSTVARKGSAATLIDTGFMLRNVDYEVNLQNVDYEVNS